MDWRHLNARAWARARGSDIKHVAKCKHLPTCTQLIKQPHRLLFPVICSDINATGRSSIYWIDSPAAVWVGSGWRAQPAVYISHPRQSPLVVFVPQLPDANLWSFGCRPIRAAVVKCILAWTRGFASVTHHSQQWGRERGWFQRPGRTLFNPRKTPFWKWFASNCHRLRQTRQCRIKSFPPITRLEFKRASGWLWTQVQKDFFVFQWNQWSEGFLCRGLKV